MSNFTATASTLKYAGSNSTTSWTSGVAQQGTYSTTNTPRVGAIQFSTLHNVDWSDQSISAITLRCTFDSAGKNSAKTLYIYGGSGTSISGASTSIMYGSAALGSVTTGGNAYNTTLTLSLSGSLLTNIISWLQAGAGNFIMLYNNESVIDGYSYSANYLQISAATMTITYEEAHKAYIGVDGVARKVNEIYVGVDGVARKVVKAYIGVDGVARKIW